MLELNVETDNDRYGAYSCLRRGVSWNVRTFEAKSGCRRRGLVCDFQGPESIHANRYPAFVQGKIIGPDRLEVDDLSKKGGIIDAAF